MDQLRQQHLQNFVTISHKMLELAQEKNWPAIESLEFERKASMEKFFDQAVEPSDSDSVAEKINEVLHINAQITRLAENEKQNVMMDVSRLKKRQQANAAYTQQL